MFQEGPWQSDILYLYSRDKMPTVAGLCSRIANHGYPTSVPSRGTSKVVNFNNDTSYIQQNNRKIVLSIEASDKS